MKIDVEHPIYDKYSIIYADPPWQYNAWTGSRKNGTADSHYDVMSPEAIKALDVNGLADKNAVLFLWATAPTLPQAIELMSVWGFVYKTVAFTWIKRNKRATDTFFFGLGHYTRANAEFCLLGVKGQPLERKSRKVFSIVDTPIKGHSEKPAVVRERIVQLFGDLPRIELFARIKPDNWDAWGNEII